MGLDLVTVLAIVVLTLLGVFLTGPGMWSEKWGWSALRKKGRRSGHGQAEDDAVGDETRARRGSGGQRR